MTVYVSLAVSATMFPDDCTIVCQSMSPYAVSMLLENAEKIVSALNPSHAATIDAIDKKFRISLPVSESAPKVKLERGDTLIIAQANFKRRLAEGERYTPEEVAEAPISFKRWTVQ